jgi:hypothetical protein
MSQRETGKIAASDIPIAAGCHPARALSETRHATEVFRRHYRRFDLPAFFFPRFALVVVFLRAALARAREEFFFLRDAAVFRPPALARADDLRFDCLRRDRPLSCGSGASALSIGFARSPAFRRSAFSTGARISGALCSTCLTASAAAAAITRFASGEGAIAFSAAVTAARTALATMPFLPMTLCSQQFPVP